MIRLFLFLLSFQVSISVYSQQKSYGFSYKFINDSLKVNKVFDNSPAAKVGIKANDFVEKINDTYTKGSNIENISALLGASDKANFIIKRGKQTFTLTATKALTTTYDRKCLSGNCLNGEGKAILFTENRIYESTFINGIPSGKTKVFTTDNKLIFDGSYSNNNAEGEGKTYYTNGEERFSGIFKNGEFVEGFWYYDNGKIYCSGKFISGNLVSGYYKTTYRGKPVFLFCDKIEGFGTDKLKFYGNVTRRADVPGGVIVSKGYYDGVWKHGWFDEYEYENDAKYVLHYNQGAIWPGDAKIFRISDGKQIAERVMFPRNATNYGNEIEGGSFKFADKTLYVGAIDKYHTIDELKKEYYSKYGGSVAASDVAGTLMLFYKSRGRPGVVHAFTIHSKVSLSNTKIESIADELRAKHGDKLPYGYSGHTFVPNFDCRKTMSIAGKSPTGNSYSDDDNNTIYCLDPYIVK